MGEERGATRLTKRKLRVRHSSCDSSCSYMAGFDIFTARRRISPCTHWGWDAHIEVALVCSRRLKTRSATQTTPMQLPTETKHDIFSLSQEALHIHCQSVQCVRKRAPLVSCACASRLPFGVQPEASRNTHIVSGSVLCVDGRMALCLRWPHGSTCVATKLPVDRLGSRRALFSSRFIFLSLAVPLAGARTCGLFAELQRCLPSVR